jgi:hypothetical protein
VDIVLGVSMTPTTVRMVLVEGEGADGLTVDHDVFDVTAIDDAANSSAPDQVISAILGTQQSALAGGHRLVATGVTWSDHDEAAALRDGLAARGIDGVTLVSDLHAAGALAQAAGRAVGYDKTALMFVERDTATLSVVETRDGSIVKVLNRSLHSADAMAVLAEMVTSLEAQHARPQGMFVVGSGVDVTSVKEHLEHLVSVPVSAPEDAAMALARGAALAAAGAPRFEATTVGLAYSQDPDASALAATELRPVAEPAPLVNDDAEVPDENRRPFLLVGSTLTTIFVIGVVALVISLAVSIRPTVDQRPNPGESVVVPSTAAPVAAPPVAEQVQAPPAAAQPAPETIPAPVPVVQQAPAAQPRQVFVEPAPAAAPAPAAPAPEAPPPAPAPAAPAPVVTPPAYTPGYYPNYPNYPVYVPKKSWWWWFPSKPPWDDDDLPEQQPTNPPQQPPWNPPQQPPWNPPTQVPSPPVTQVPSQPPAVAPQQQPSVVQPQQPVATQEPLVPLVPVIQKPLVPDQPVLPPLPVIQDPVVPQQPRQPVIQQPRQPSGPSTRGPRNNNPFWPFGDGH